MTAEIETLITNSKIKPIGYAQMQPLLTYESMVPMYSTKGEAQNGYEMVSLYSADQVAFILEETIAALAPQPAVAPDKANPAGMFEDRHLGLSTFYQVETYADMVDKMETQIDRLQKRTNSLYTQSALTKVREG